MKKIDHIALILLVFFTSISFYVLFWEPGKFLIDKEKSDVQQSTTR